MNKNTTTQHTPGPWKNDPPQPTIWAKDGDDHYEKLMRFLETVKTQAAGDLNGEQFRAYILKLTEDL